MTNIKLAKKMQKTNAVGYTEKYAIMNNPRPQSGTTRLSLMLMTMPMAKIDEYPKSLSDQDRLCFTIIGK